jgi:hypothetical protein
MVAEGFTRLRFSARKAIANLRAARGRRTRAT